MDSAQLGQLKTVPCGKVLLLRYRIYLGMTGLSLSRMSTNNQISPMQFCCNTGFILPKQSQRSRSVL